MAVFAGEKGTTKHEMVGWHHWLEHEFEQALGVDDGQGSVVCCSTQGHKESDTTEQLNWFGVTAFPGGSDGEESTCNAGMWLLSLGQENPPGEGNGYPLHYSCLENSMNRGTCPQATANGLQRLLHEWATNTLICHKKSSIFREVAGCDSFDMQQLEFHLQTYIHETIWTITKDYFTLCMNFLFLPEFTLGKYFLVSEENTYRIVTMHIPNSNLVFEKTLESLLDCKEIKLVNPKGNQLCYSLEGVMLKLKLRYFGHLMRRADSLEKTLMLGRMEGKKRRGWQKIR